MASEGQPFSWSLRTDILELLPDAFIQQNQLGFWESDAFGETGTKASVGFMDTSLPQLEFNVAWVWTIPRPCR